jgi:hypothetical protein
VNIHPTSGPLRATLGAVLAVFLFAAALEPSPAQARFTRVVAIALDRPVELSVSLPHGDVEIVHGRDEQVAITVSAPSPGQPLDETLVAASLAIEQAGNEVRLRYAHNPAFDAAKPKLSYRVAVPHWTTLDASVGVGTLTILGVMGPVRATVDRGAIRASYISKELSAMTQTGDLDIEVVGGRVSASAGTGNISCLRITQGVSVATDDGDIVLMVVGSSDAIVRKGTGRIDVGGARGSLNATTYAGDLHVRSVPHERWDLRSESGNIRLELPHGARFEIDAAAESGQVAIKREDIEQPTAPLGRLHQKVNGGGKHIDVRNGSGKIVVQ